MKKLWDRIGGAIGIIMTLIFALIVANDIWHFISSVYLVVILNEAIYYGGIALVIITTLEMIANSNIIIKILFTAVWVVIIVYSFSPTLFGLLA
jgi:hypothetical protein